MAMALEVWSLFSSILQPGLPLVKRRHQRAPVLNCLAAHELLWIVDASYGGQACIPCWCMDCLLHSQTTTTMSDLQASKTSAELEQKTRAHMKPLPQELTSQFTSVDAVVPEWRGAGICNNTGENNCFLSALIQCLWACAGFRHLVLSLPAFAYKVCCLGPSGAGSYSRTAWSSVVAGMLSIPGP